MKIEDKLKFLREEKNWSKVETAKKLGVAGSTYSNWEYGNKKPKIASLKKISNLYGVPISYLITDSFEDTIESERQELRQIEKSFIDQQIDQEQSIKNLRYYFENLHRSNSEDEFEDITLKIEELTAFFADLSDNRDFSELLKLYKKHDPDFTNLIEIFYKL